MRRLVAAVLLSAAVMVPAAVSAAWSATGSGTSPVSATRMTNATNFTAACASKSVVTLSWTISPDIFVESYEIVRTSGSGATTLLPLVARTTSTVSDSPPPGPNRTTSYTYSYTIRSVSTAHPWVTPRLAALQTVSLTSNACTSSP